MTYSANTYDDASGECDPTVVSLASEDFGGLCNLTDSGMIASDANWLAYAGGAYASGCYGGALELEAFDSTGLDDVTITFDIVSSNVCNFEATGRYADAFSVQVMTATGWATLDTFVRSGDALVGAVTGQSFGACGWTELSFTVSDPGPSAQFRIVADFTASDEAILVDNIAITGTQACDDVCEPIVVSLLSEDFSGLYCVPSESDNVTHSAGWDTYYGYAFSNGCNDGGMTFAKVQAAEYDRITFDFDIATNDVGVWEASGRHADWVKVMVHDGTSWAVLDKFVRDGHELVGNNTGQTIKGHFQTLSYTVDAPTDHMKFKIVTSMTASNETIWVDNVEIAGITDVDCGPGGPNVTDAVGALGDRVWLDVNANGIQDAGEQGVEGITFELIANGVATGRTVTTGANGFYLFEELEAGDYAVQVTGAPEGYAFTTAGQGDETEDSDVDASGLSETYTLSADVTYLDLDAGLVAIPPVVSADAGMVCADETKTLDVLANDDAGLTITAINGETIGAGGVTLGSGATVSLNAAGALVYDGIAAWTGLSYLETASDTFTYTATTAQGGSATTTVSMMVAGYDAVDLNEIARGLDGQITFTITELDDSVFMIDAMSADNVRLNVTGSGNVFCVDLAGDVPALTLQANVFIADENNAALGEFVPNYQNLDLVNYIMNRDYSTGSADVFEFWTGTTNTVAFSDLDISATDIQDAIWYLTDDLFTLLTPDVAAIVADAEANGEGFVAQSGDIVGLVIAPLQEQNVEGVDVTNFQNFIYGVEFDVLAEGCLI
jgi:hypothetical protein